MRRSMATAASAALRIHGRDVALSADAGVDIERCLASVVFRDWVSSLPPAMVVSAVRFQSLDLFGPRVGFIKFAASATLSDAPVPGIVFMRGGAVAILVVVECDDAEYAIITRQPRLPIGSAGFDEIPAGMLDGSGHFAGVAAKELEEETGIVIRDSDLVDLSELAYAGMPLSKPMTTTTTMTATTSTTAAVTTTTTTTTGAQATVRGVYPTAGGSDEFIRLFLFRTAITREQLDALLAKEHGEGGHERIVLRVVPFGDLWRSCADMKTLSALCLYDRLRAEGRIPERR